MHQRVTKHWWVLVAVAGSIGWQSSDPPDVPPDRPPILRRAPRVGTSVQLPTFGISIDAEGLLALKVVREPTGQLHQQRMQAAAAQLAPEVARQSPLRKVSLVKLERAIRERLDEGRKLDDVMQHLAGLQRIDYVFCYPKQHDLVIAGPAEGWMADGAGRAVGLTTGQPVLQLVDWLVAQRAYPPGRGRGKFIGCTIDPTPQGLSALQAFQKTIPRSVSTSQRRQVLRYVAHGTEKALGMAQIRVFGVSPRTHFAGVLVEADYRMKRIGLGLERPPVRIASFLDLIRTPRQGTLQRWWFTPNYDCVKVTEDSLAMQLVGQGVQLQTEDKVIGPGGTLLASGQANLASEKFTAGFTAKYPQLAANSPVYAQLRTLIDMVIVAAFMQRENYYGEAGWSPSTFADEKRLPVETEPAMKQVPATCNSIWRGSRLLAPAGGGISINAHLALESERLIKDVDGRLARQRSTHGSDLPVDRWWWD